ncbi:MAG: TraR/DksA C4-type zinc finger protein [Desulfobacteraceae bacterium]|nr:TraR/DksA C4-type zinc finger protein [Desulfobacteraceae bacterium]MDH3723593.1 TraR/DksA C4-type zinc finger protein [Desulfobacteraceae bacterium]MDH3837043.1 TraR/DksA C4-type zinc finger protein [Desulfobacteraceae bacterium]
MKPTDTRLVKSFYTDKRFMLNKEKLENHIREKIEVLKENIISYRQLTKPIPPDNSIGRLTRMESISSKSINEAALRNANDTLSKLERVLKTINDSDFGLCRECEEPIPFARLMIVPETDMCVECADKRE